MINHINLEQTGKPKPLRPCKYCGGLGHTAFGCRKKPKKPLTTKRRMRPIGKVGKQWIATREEWFKKHPADFYVCYLQVSPLCPGTMTKAETTLDHVKSRGRHPELRFNQDNLMPCCNPCNSMKGSRDADEYNKNGGLTS